MLPLRVHLGLLVLLLGWSGSAALAAHEPVGVPLPIDAAAGPPPAAAPQNPKAAGVATIGPTPTETVVPARIIAASVFKNGLAWITQQLEVPGPGDYLVGDPPEPAHGTFWIDSAARVEISRVTRETGDPVFEAGRRDDLQRTLAGQEVTVHFAVANVPPVTGVVASPAVTLARPGTISGHDPSDDPAWPLLSARPRFDRDPAATPGDGPGGLLVLATPTGTAYVDLDRVAAVLASGRPIVARQPRPALRLRVTATTRHPEPIRFSYLARGLSWAPAYRLDVSAPNRLKLRQNAVVRNELAPLHDVEIHLTAGFPNLQFAHVSSPLNGETTWATFFRQLANPNDRSLHPRGREMVMQQAVMSNVAPDDPGPLDAIPAGEGADLHQQPFGRVSLAVGEATMADVESGEADYERIVEWRVPDTRHADGRLVQRGYGGDDPEWDDAPWDALLFRNPLPFAMTTGAVLVVADGRIQGQGMVGFANRGEAVSVRITKALSIRARAHEQEEPGERGLVYIGGNDFRKVTVNGSLTINNHRREAVKMTIRRRFSGELVHADANPACTLREEGVTSVNRRQELRWTLSLTPGEEKTLQYTYHLLVDN